MFPPGLEPGTFRVLGERDNHYTTETVQKVQSKAFKKKRKGKIIQTLIIEASQIVRPNQNVHVVQKVKRFVFGRLLLCCNNASWQ